MKTNLRNQSRPRRRAFTLIELLVVISIIAVLTALLIPTLAGVFKAKKISTVKGEMEFVKSALENYKAKYGVYPPCNPTNALVNQLYYELSGVTSYTDANGPGYKTLDGLYSVTANSFAKTFGGAGGLVNCSKGSGEDAVTAKNFVLGLKPAEITSATNADQILVPYLVTSVGGPDVSYHPTYSFNGNPFRYLYPGVHNPNSYDLWVKLSINQNQSTAKYLICNWNSQVQVDSSLP